MVKFVETGRRMMVIRGQDEGELGSWCLMDAEFLCEMMEKFWEMDGGDFCATL